MKTIVLGILAILFAVAPLGIKQGQAAITVTELNAKAASEEALFGVNLKEINKIQGTNTLQLEFETVDMKPNTGIDHWKIRMWCEGNVQVGLTRLNNHCEQVVTIPAASVRDFMIFATKVKGERTEFSFKLKAYDKAGKWLHSEEERFQW